MTVKAQIKDYLTNQPAAKQKDMQELHRLILQWMPACKLWFLDGRDSSGKIVSNPNIGYGEYMIQYANGTSKPFFQVGLSANSSGISVYVMGIPDKTYLPKNFGKKIGKASVTGYCIKFKSLKDIHLEALEAAIRYGAAVTR